jgi:hypothetical protein
MSVAITKNLGMLFLAIYLILVGLLSFIPALSGVSPVLPIIALIAGVLILLGK